MKFFFLIGWNFSLKLQPISIVNPTCPILSATFFYVFFKFSGAAHINFSSIIFLFTQLFLYTTCIIFYANNAHYTTTITWHINQQAIMTSQWCFSIQKTWMTLPKHPISLLIIWYPSSLRNLRHMCINKFSH